MPEIRRRRGAQTQKPLAPERPADDSQALEDLEDGEELDLGADDGDPVEETPAPRRRSRTRAADPALDPAPAETAAPNASPAATEDFWTAVAGRDEVFWGNHNAYLYRTHPQVLGGMNGSKHNYISIFSRNFDIEDVRQLHGGGGYKAVLKNQASRKQVMPDFFFSIEGDPKFIAGQRFKESGEPVPVGSPAPPAPQPSATSDAAGIIRELASVLKSDKPAENALADAVKIIKEVRSLDVTSEKKGETSSLADALKLIKELRSLDGDKKSETSSLSEALTLIKEIRKLDDRGDREDNPSSGGIGQLKDLLGSDTVGDLVMRGLEKGAGGAGEAGWGIFARAAEKLADNLPQIIAGVKDLIAQQMQIAMMRNGAQPQRPALPAARPGTIAGAPPVVTGAPPAGVAPAQIQPAPIPTTGPTQEEVNANLDRIKASIVQSFDAGDPGDMAAVSVARTFPDLVPALKPYFAQVDAVVIFAKSDQILSAIASHEEFPQFAEDFIAKLQNPAWVPPDEEDEEEETPSPILLKTPGQGTQPDGPKPA